ncbi:hypothetical protein [Paenibacillus xylanexedens]|uniref:hypothetical protein n=1 Tax=Paenibacillus xylanexedens TaxID=528191 RepID=UPI0011A9A1AA|nr:hypothetical protein [Paenibacillus xylanexedens]
MAAPRKSKTVEVETTEQTMVAEAASTGAAPAETLKAPKTTAQAKKQLWTEDYALTIGYVRGIPVGPGASVTVENLGGGDLFASPTVLGLQGNIESPIRPGETREFEGNDQVVLTAYSRPTARVTYFGK